MDSLQDSIKGSTIDKMTPLANVGGIGCLDVHSSMSIFNYWIADVILIYAHHPQVREI